MKPDDLLTDLTLCPSAIDTLLQEARQQRRRRRETMQASAAAAAIIALAITAIRLGASGTPTATGPALTATAPAASPLLNKHELLEAFGDQPVALVTWPDGRQKLLAIQRPAPRRSGTR